MDSSRRTKERWGPNSWPDPWEGKTKPGVWGERGWPKERNGQGSPQYAPPLGLSLGCSRRPCTPAWIMPRVEYPQASHRLPSWLTWLGSQERVSQKNTKHQGKRWTETRGEAKAKDFFSLLFQVVFNASEMGSFRGAGSIFSQNILLKERTSFSSNYCASLIKFEIKPAIMT